MRATATRVRWCSRRARVAIHASLLVALVALGVSCSSAGPHVVVLPPESVRFERFLNAPGTLTADRIQVQALTAYRKDTAPVVSSDVHSKSVTPERIVLINETGLPNMPVRLTFRNLQLVGRERIDVVFSDVPLERPQDGAPILLFIAHGVARLKAAGDDLLAECIVIRNDEARPFEADCQTPAPVLRP